MALFKEEADMALAPETLRSGVSVVVAGLVLALASCAPGTDSTACVSTGKHWESQVVDNAGGLFSSTTTAYNQLHAFYYDSSRGAGNLQHAWLDSSWHTETLDGHRNGPRGEIDANVGLFGTSTVVYRNQLHVFYADNDHGDLRHAFYNGAWNFETLDGGGSTPIGAGPTATGYFSAAVVFGDELTVFYFDQTRREIREAVYSPTFGWYIETRATNVTIGTSLSAVVYDNGIHLFYERQGEGLREVIYQHWTQDGLRYLGWGGDHVIDSEGYGTRAATAYRGQLQIFYVTTGGVLRHAWYEGRWHYERDFAHSGASISFSRETNPVAIAEGHLLHVFYSNGILRYAYWDLSQWRFGVIDGDSDCFGQIRGPVGMFPSAAVFRGLVHAFYYADYDGGLRLSRLVNS
jgi:hypothetical protein